MMSNFEKSIRHSLIDKDMTVKDLSKQIGKSVPYIHEIMKGTRTCKKTVEEICQILEVVNPYDDESVDGKTVC